VSGLGHLLWKHLLGCFLLFYFTLLLLGSTDENTTDENTTDDIQCREKRSENFNQLDKRLHFICVQGLLYVYWCMTVSELLETICIDFCAKMFLFQFLPSSNSMSCWKLGGSLVYRNRFRFIQILVRSSLPGTCYG
jgi:hypothetical protein